MEEPLKQVIIVNEALKLPRGKLAAQVAHAAISAFLEASPSIQSRWLEAGMPKVVLAGENAAFLVNLETEAHLRSLPNSLIADAGRTLIPSGTITCLGIGPAPNSSIDQLTGNLKLLS